MAPDYDQIYSGIENRKTIQAKQERVFVTWTHDLRSHNPHFHVHITTTDIILTSTILHGSCTISTFLAHARPPCPILLGTHHLSLWKQFDTIFMLPVIRIVMNSMIKVPAQFSMLNFARNTNSMIGYYLLVCKISPWVCDLLCKIFLFKLDWKFHQLSFLSCFFFLVFYRLLQY